jgi:hypothetical protein
LSDSREKQFPGEVLEQMDNVMLWLESIEQISSTKFMEHGGHFTIRVTTNSKIMASLFQGHAHQQEGIFEILPIL